MQVLRMAGPLLEDFLVNDTPNPNQHLPSNLPTPEEIETMSDAHQASAALSLPYYWFADPRMRSKFRIPHYLLGGLVRFRMSELFHWAAQSNGVQGRSTDAPAQTQAKTHTTGGVRD